MSRVADFDSPDLVPGRRFAPAPRVQIQPAIAARVAAYQAGLLAELHHEPEAFRPFVRLAMREAESLAWSTPYAHLFLPALAEEKINYARQWARRQQRVGNGLTAMTPAGC